MDRKMMEQATRFEGTVPPDWEVLGIVQNQHCRFRYYKDAAGKYWYTAQKLKRDHMKLSVREENGRTYAKNVYVGPRRKRRRMA